MKSRCREWVSLLSDIGGVAALVLMVLGFVWSALGGLPRGGLVVIVVVLAGAFCTIAWFRRRAWWRIVGPRYLSGVMWLAGPVRDELTAMVVAVGERGREESEGELRERVTGLSNQGLGSLRGLLRVYRPTGSRTFKVTPRSDAETEAGLTREQKVTRYALACEELAENGFISAWHMAEDSEGVVVTMSRRVRPGLILRLQDWVGEELNARGVRLVS